MSRKKIFIFSNQTEHFWYSCNVIEDAVHEVLGNEPNISWFESQGDVSAAQKNEIHITSQTSDTFVYLLSDNMKFENIVDSLADIPNLTYIIPIYGNMTVEFVRWTKLDKVLRGKKVVFASASHRQCQQLTKLIKGGTIAKVPYPIGKKHFIEPSLGDEKNIHLVYAGRFTPQKNILDLMKVFNLVQKDRPELKLHLAGDFHERGYHLHGLQFDLETFKEEFHSVIEASQGSIIFHGFLDQDSLIELNRNCDYAISMSTYHDEDFGVSIAQALAQGVVPLLTDWGGHPDFARLLNQKLCKVVLDERNVPHFSHKDLYIRFLSLTKIDIDQRTTNQRNVIRYLGAPAFISRLHQMTTLSVEEYHGQTDLYLKYAEVAQKYFPFAQGIVSVDYLDIYESYIKDFVDYSHFEII